MALARRWMDGAALALPNTHNSLFSYLLTAPFFPPIPIFFISHSSPLLCLILPSLSPHTLPSLRSGSDFTSFAQASLLLDRRMKDVSGFINNHQHLQEVLKRLLCKEQKKDNILLNGVLFTLTVRQGLLTFLYSMVYLVTSPLDRNKHK